MALLSVRDLSIWFGGPGHEVQAARDVAFDIQPGERVGIVGESGCGKTVTGLALLGLLPRATSRVTGSAVMDGRNLLTLPPKALRAVRGTKIGMIFQEPMSALDPVFTVGTQIGETIRTHFGGTKARARDRAIEVLTQVGIPSPERVHDSYPHQLSGGMRQRVMIAIARRTHHRAGCHDPGADRRVAAGTVGAHRHRAAVHLPRSRRHRGNLHPDDHDVRG